MSAPLKYNIYQKVKQLSTGRELCFREDAENLIGLSRQRISLILKTPVDDDYHMDINYLLIFKYLLNEYGFTVNTVEELLNPQAYNEFIQPSLP